MTIVAATTHPVRPAVKKRQEPKAKAQRPKARREMPPARPVVLYAPRYTSPVLRQDGARNPKPKARGRASYADRLIGLAAVGHLPKAVSHYLQGNQQVGLAPK